MGMFVFGKLKGYFDIKVVLVFLSVFLLSSFVIIINLNNDEECRVREFKVEATSLEVGELIIFSDVSQNAHSWRWYFGDNSQISFRSKVGHIFMKEGDYLIRLIVNNECSIEKLVTIVSKKSAVDNSKMPVFSVASHVLEGEKIDFEDRTEGAKSWEWRFGESGKVDSFDEKCSYMFTSPGVKSISLIVNNDYKHVTVKEIFVVPKKEEKIKIEKYKSDIPHNPFQNIPDAPPEDLNAPVKVAKGPEIGGTDAGKLESLLESVAKGKTSYDNFLKHFCKYNLPIVIYRDAKTSTLREFFNAVKKKGDRVKDVRIQKDTEDCIRVINVDKKHKHYF